VVGKSGESSSVGRTAGVEEHSHHVDGDVVVIPAEAYQIVRVVVPTGRALSDVVGLEPVAAAAPVDLAASLVAVQHPGANRRRDRFSQIGDPDRPSVFTLHDHSYFSGAEQFGEGVGSHPWSRGEGDSGLPVAGAFGQLPAGGTPPPGCPPPPPVAPSPLPSPPPPGQLYDNCTEVWNGIGRPIYTSDPGYGRHLDRDGDGVGCETDPR